MLDKQQSQNKGLIKNFSYGSLMTRINNEDNFEIIRELVKECNEK